MNAATSLYWMYDDGDHLLYVGISDDLPRRMLAHAADKDWWHQVAMIRVQHFETREEAREAEGVAIETYRPKYNRADAHGPYVKMAVRPNTFRNTRLGFGRTVLGVRYHTGIRRPALAAEIGMTANRLYRIETGVAKASEAEKGRIAAALGVTRDELNDLEVRDRARSEGWDA